LLEESPLATLIHVVVDQGKDSSPTGRMDIHRATSLDHVRSIIELALA
jgi:hypothetical protein